MWASKSADNAGCDACWSVLLAGGWCRTAGVNWSSRCLLAPLSYILHTTCYIICVPFHILHTTCCIRCVPFHILYIYPVYTLYLISHPCLTHNLLYHTYPLISHISTLSLIPSVQSHNLIAHLTQLRQCLHYPLSCSDSEIRYNDHQENQDTEHGPACNPVLNSSIWFTLHLILIIEFWDSVS